MSAGNLCTKIEQALVKDKFIAIGLNFRVKIVLKFKAKMAENTVLGHENVTNVAFRVFQCNLGLS